MKSKYKYTREHAIKLNTEVQLKLTEGHISVNLLGYPVRCQAMMEQYLIGKIDLAEVCMVLEEAHWMLTH